MRIIFITGNPHKLREAKEILQPRGNSTTS